MAETKQITLLVLVTLLIGVATLLLLPKGPIFFGGDLIVDNYEVTFLSDGSLIEKYTYDVENSGQYRMLYRYWDDILSFERLGRAHIEFIGINHPPGTIGYAKNYVGDVVVYGDSKYKYTIDSLAYTNEVGAYNPSYYNKGKYTLEYKYILRPPIQYDDEFSHLNLKFLREHIPIKKFKIILPKEYIVKIYPHPPKCEDYRGFKNIYYYW